MINVQLSVKLKNDIENSQEIPSDQKLHCRNHSCLFWQKLITNIFALFYFSNIINKLE
jgi:hypothetical protein